MPCPLFEPRRKLDSDHPLARLPLIYEFEGICQATGEAAPALYRFQYCNRGNARGECPHFPADQMVSAVRFNVTAKTSERLSVLVIEEENHWPRATRQIDFRIGEERLEPEIEDVCRRAQIFRFCQSYLEKFS
jgi:hypothetical protein